MLLLRLLGIVKVGLMNLQNQMTRPKRILLGDLNSKITMIRLRDLKINRRGSKKIWEFLKRECLLNKVKECLQLLRAISLTFKENLKVRRLLTPKTIPINSKLLSQIWERARTCLQRSSSFQTPKTTQTSKTNYWTRSKQREVLETCQTTRNSSTQRLSPVE